MHCPQQQWYHNTFCDCKYSQLQPTVTEGEETPLKMQKLELGVYLLQCEVSFTEFDNWDEKRCVSLVLNWHTYTHTAISMCSIIAI